MKKEKNKKLKNENKRSYFYCENENKDFGGSKEKELN